jgi:hypothetical protein
VATDAGGLVSRVSESILASKDGRLMLRAGRPVANLQKKYGQKSKFTK